MLENLQRNCLEGRVAVTKPKTVALAFELGSRWRLEKREEPVGKG